MIQLFGMLLGTGEKAPTSPTPGMGQAEFLNFIQSLKIFQEDVSNHKYCRKTYVN